MASIGACVACETRLTQGDLDDLVRRTRDRFGVPAVAVIALNSKGVTLQSVQGVRVAGRADSVTADDYFHIGSVSKSALSWIAARLVAQGRVSWDTEFFAVFPEWRDSADPGYARVTLEDLLSCRAGIRPYTLLEVDPLPEYGLVGSEARRAFVRDLVRQPPSAPKGRDGRFRLLYSNASYTMAALLLEEVSGQSYESLVDGVLNREMGLATKPGWPNRIGADQPWGHMITRDGVEPMGPEHPYRMPDLLAPAGDLSMTVRDYAEYTRRHLAGLRGEDTAIAGDEYERIHFGHEGFALGAGGSRFRGERVSNLAGTTGTFYAVSYLAPESDFALVILMNAGAGAARMEAVEWLSRALVARHYGMNRWQRMWLRWSL